MLEARPTILIAGDSFGFPDGLGASSRVRAYARGLLENGAAVKVLCLDPTEPRSGPVINSQARGNWDGVDYAYTYGSTAPHRSFLMRRWLRLTAPWRFYRAVQSQANDGRCDALLLFGMSLPYGLTALLAARLHHVRLLKEQNELPFVYCKRTLRLRVYQWLFETLVFGLADGVVVISRHLERYMAGRISPKARMVRLPILVDVDRFALAAASHDRDRPYIVYSGQLDESKGVDILIKAFAVVAERFPDLDLVIAGSDFGNGFEQKLKVLASSLGLESRVRFLGLLSARDFLGRLKGARVAVMPHPAGAHSLANFPTKLGEYLASGIPVVATRVGEIEDYVADGTDLFLVPPDDVHALAEKLNFVLSHEAEARQVGERGQATARKQFDYRMHTRNSPVRNPGDGCTVA